MSADTEEEEVFYDAADDNEQKWEQQQAAVAAHHGGELEDPTRYESVYELHKAAYYDDTARLSALLQRLPPDQHTALDLHGNTALHVAAMRGNTAAVEVLLAAGLPAKTRSSRGWTALEEACGARSITTAKVLQVRMLSDAKAEMKSKRAQLLDSMRQMPDYSLQLKWQLGSSVPGLGLLLRKYAPHDTYTIWNVGNKLRVDGSLMGIDTKSSMIPEWKRGHFSLIVDGSPEGIAAAAAAAEEAVAAARAAAQLKQQQRWGSRTQQQQQQQQQHRSAGAGGAAAGDASPDPAAPTTPSGSTFGDTAGGGGGAAGAGAADSSSHSSSHSSSTSSSRAQQQQPQPPPQQQEFFDPEPTSPSPSSAAAAAGGSNASQQQQQQGGPRLLFLNHTKGSWVDLSADKKALKLEGVAATAAAEGDEGGGVWGGMSSAEQEEAMAELQAAMNHDMEKVRLKPRNFKFAPVRGWLGGEATERVEGWKCTVYEAAGKLVAVSTNKARLALSPSSTFEDYLAAEYAADTVSEILVDPLTPSGLDIMSSGKKDKSYKGGSVYGAGDDTMGGAGDDFGGGDEELWGLTADESQQQQQGGGSNKKSSLLSSSSSKKSSSSSNKKSNGSSSKDSAQSGAAAEDSSSGSSSSSAGGRVLRARCWMAEGFPMSMSQLLPLLDVIGSTANKHMGKVGKFLAKYSSMELFPVKLQVPLLLTVYAVVSFKAFHLLQQQPQGATTGSSSSNKSSQQSPQPAPADDFFSVPEGYKRRKLQDVMEKSAKNTFGDFGGGGSNPWGADDEDDDDDFFGGGGGGGGGRGSGGSYVWPGSGLGGGGGGGSRRPAPAVFYGGDAGAEYLTEEDVSGMGGAGR